MRPFLSGVRASFLLSVLAALIAASCSEPYVVVDDSDIGEGPLAVQVSASLSAGTDENNERQHQRWLNQVCMIQAVADARECGTRIGMNCGDSSGEEAICRYSGTLRSRMRNRRLPPDYIPKDTAWYRRTAVVELRFRNGEPATLTYRSHGEHEGEQN